MTSLVAAHVANPGGGRSNPGSGHLAIGRHRPTADAIYNSVMADELTLWDRILTAQEVLDIYNANPIPP